ncbi:hypothetical protein [Thermococcus thioreducens]|uniref:Uncharacterized protein n=1 Tax=Thermococcus thioreducens TaxID=277988 RepID=A0A0Q2M184_9EURY|nr:hypothetical protein [Thermococcus thioreducens]ASJ13118.1 hypothetical protein A3L14_09560 [Thermococcus thioreducens]KQH81626.1 hypothetical protein AMR53_10435 [Thermococcus thioreducens]SEV80858.1 hypothetical protein SAMN05216170_0024 [Thermococcus thioreducens]
MSCIKPPEPGKVRDLREESFIREGKGKLRVVIESEGERIEATMNGSLKSVSEIAEMLGVEVQNGRIEAVVDGVKVSAEHGKLEMEFENGDRLRIEKA